MFIKIRLTNTLLLLPGLSALTLSVGWQYFPATAGFGLGIFVSYLLKKISSSKTLTYTIIIWLALALASALLNSFYLAIASVTYLMTSLGYVALTEDLGAGEASIIFFLTYLIPESLLEVIKLGLPPYKYLPYLIKLGSCGWSVPELPVRITYAISAGYLLTTYFLRNAKVNTITSMMLILSGIYALVTAVLTSFSGLPNAYYVAAIMGLLPLAILTLSLKVGKV